MQHKKHWQHDAALWFTRTWKNFARRD